MTVKGHTKITKTTYYEFSEEDIIDALFNMLEKKKSFKDECTFDIGEGYIRGATVTIIEEKNEGD